MRRVVSALLIVLSLVSAINAENIVFPEKAGVPDITKPPYNAKGDGKTDDTAAFQKALMDEHKLIYVPNGEYVISDTLRWGDGEKRQVLQGQSMAGTILRIQDNAPAFQNTANPRPMIWTGKEPAQRFRNGVRNLTFDIGMGNPGAIGAQFIANNQGGMEYVTFRDRSGLGKIGLDLGYTDEQGPLLLKHVAVEGFDVGVSLVGAVDSVTAEHMTLNGQRHAGIRNTGQVLNIRGLVSRNSVPAIVNTGASMLTLLDSELTGQDASKLPAIANSAGVFARNVRTPGYAMAVENKAGHKRNAEGQTIREFVSHDPLSLFPSPVRSLNLPIKETPEVEWDPADKWVSVTDFGEPEPVELRRTSDGKKFKATNYVPALQKAIDSGATTIYFPYTKGGSYGLFGNIHLRKNVKRIIGLETTGYRMVANTEDKSMFGDEFCPTFILEDGASPAVVVERFDTWYTPFGFVQKSKRALVVRSLSFHDVQTQPDSGDVFLEDCRAKQVVVSKGAKVWARQLNPEGHEEPRIDVNGGQMWVLGLKTECDATIGGVRNGGRLEVSGGFIYANKNQKWPKQMFVNRGGSLTATVGEWVTRRDGPFNVLVEERDGQEKVIAKRSVYPRGTGSLVPLLVSYRLPADAPPKPLTDLKAVPLGTDRIQVTWAPAKDADGVIVRLVKDGKTVSEKYVAADPASFVFAGAAAGAQYQVEAAAYNGAGSATPAACNVAMPAGAAKSDGTGLQGVYFGTLNLEGDTASRVDPAMDFTWTNGPAIEGLNAKAFSVRWTGTLTPQYSEVYRFHFEYVGRLRMWLGDTLLIDQPNSKERARAEMELTAGQAYPIRIEYQAGGKESAIKIEWNSANQSREVLRAPQLRPATVALAEVRLEADVKTVAESAGKLAFTVKLKRPASFDKEVVVGLVAAGSAVAAGDCDVPSQVVVPAGQDSVQASITLRDNLRSEPSRSLTVQAASNVSLLTAGPALDITVTDDDAPPAGKGTGLLGSYYADVGMKQLVGTRLDRAIDFNWDKKAPLKGVDPAKPYAIRWQGEMQPLYDETYTIEAGFGKYGAARVLVDGQTIIDAWDKPDKALKQATIKLEPGKRYKITVDYRNDRFYGAAMHLFWSSPSQYRQPIPSSQLYPIETKAS